MVQSLESLANAFSVKDIRNRILNVALGFTIFVLTIHITVPGVNMEVWKKLLESHEIFNFLGLFTGGALNKFSICAMGITPYINASIIMQLLTIVFDKLKEMATEGGEEGRKKISQYTRILTIVLAFVQSGSIVLTLSKSTNVFRDTSFFYLLTVIVSLTAGTAFLMWLSEQLSDKGIGNGVSMLIFVGIVLRYPQQFMQTILQTREGGLNVLNLLLFLAIAIGLIVAIVAIQQGQRRVPVQYTKRVVGRKVMGGQSTYLPIKVNNAGVISIIFAISIMYFPITIVGFLPDKTNWFAMFIKNYFHSGTFLYNLAFALLVILFTYFYSAVTFNTNDIANNMKKYGGFIPGIRPGPPTTEYLGRILNRLTFVSAIFLAFLAIAPTLVMRLTHVTSFYLGSTSLLIVVGVALDVMQQIEARLVMRHYQGFMK